MLDQTSSLLPIPSRSSVIPYGYCPPEPGTFFLLHGAAVSHAVSTSVPPSWRVEQWHLHACMLQQQGSIHVQVPEKILSPSTAPTSAGDPLIDNDCHLPKLGEAYTECAGISPRAENYSETEARPSGRAVPTPAGRRSPRSWSSKLYESHDLLAAMVKRRNYTHLVRQIVSTSDL